MREYRQEVWEDFVYWVHERQKIFDRKVIRGEESPWTDDPILRERHFCNVYRELDRVSRWYINHLVGIESQPRDHILNSLILRTTNRSETMELIGPQTADEFDYQSVTERVIEASESGRLETVFNSAYMITGTIGPRGEKKIKTYSREVWNEFADNHERFVEAMRESPESFISELTTLPGVAEFIAYEIYCDLTYHEWFPWDENQYVNPGPGAKRCIQRLLGRDPINPNQHRDIDYVSHIEEIRDDQDSWLREDWISWRSRDLTLRHIEHSLCEVDKYRRASEKTARGESVRLQLHQRDERPLGIDEESETTRGQDTF